MTTRRDDLKDKSDAKRSILHYIIIRNSNQNQAQFRYDEFFRELKLELSLCGVNDANHASIEAVMKEVLKDFDKPVHFEKNKLRIEKKYEKVQDLKTLVQHLNAIYPLGIVENKTFYESCNWKQRNIQKYKKDIARESTRLDNDIRVVICNNEKVMYSTKFDKEERPISVNGEVGKLHIQYDRHPECMDKDQYLLLCKTTGTNNAPKIQNQEEQKPKKSRGDTRHNEWLSEQFAELKRQLEEEESKKALAKKGFMK